jgi:transposase-like protein
MYRAIFVPTNSRRALVLATARMLRDAGDDDLTVETLAHQLGVSRSTVYRWGRRDPGLLGELEPLLGATHRTLSLRLAGHGGAVSAERPTTA